MTEKLRSGDPLPPITFDLVDSGNVSLPGDLKTDFAVVLFYRGHW